MNRLSPYKFYLVLAIFLAGIICMMLPEKKQMPIANVGDVLKMKSANNTDTLKEIKDTFEIIK